MARIFTDGGAMKLISAAQRLTNELSWSVAFPIFRTGTPAANRAIISAADVTQPVGFGVRLLTTNLLQAFFPYTTTDKVRSSSSSPTLNAWTHVIVVHQNTGLNSTDLIFYFNGKSEAGTSITNGSGTHDQATAVAIEVGSSTADALSAPPAQIGPIAIWNRALSPAEALALAGGMHPLRFQEGLVEVFDLDAAHGEEGWLAKLFLVQGATNPTSAAVSPPMEAPTISQLETSMNVRPSVISRARYIAISAVNTPIALAVTSAFTAALAKAMTYARSLPVSSTFAPAQSRVAGYFRALAVSTGWTTTLSRFALRFKTLSTNGAFTAALAKFNTRPIAVAASGTWTPAIARAQGKLLAVASTFAPALSRKVSYLRTLSVGSTFAAVLQRCITKPLAVGSTFVVSLVKGRLTLKSLAATSTFTAAITRAFGYGRSLAVSSTFAPALTKRLSLSRLLAATSAFVPAVTKRLALRIGLGVSSVFAAILAKIKFAFGGEFSSLTGNVRNYPRLDGDVRAYARLAGNTRTGPRLDGDVRSQARLAGDGRSYSRLEGEVRNYPAAA